MTSSDNNNLFKKIKKPPYIGADEFAAIKAAVASKKGDKYPPIAIRRRVEITNYMVGYKFKVNNGSKKIKVIQVQADMVGYKFGDFYPTRTFVKHGGDK